MDCTMWRGLQLELAGTKGCVCKCGFSLRLCWLKWIFVVTGLVQSIIFANLNCYLDSAGTQDYSE